MLIWYRSRYRTADAPWLELPLRDDAELRTWLQRWSGDFETTPTRPQHDIRQLRAWLELQRQRRGRA